jgi:hypothetical protein
MREGGSQGGLDNLYKSIHIICSNAYVALCLFSELAANSLWFDLELAEFTFKSVYNAFHRQGQGRSHASWSPRMSTSRRVYATTDNGSLSNTEQITDQHHCFNDMIMEGRLENSVIQSFIITFINRQCT